MVDLPEEEEGDTRILAGKGRRLSHRGRRQHSLLHPMVVSMQVLSLRSSHLIQEKEVAVLVATFVTPDEGIGDKTDEVLGEGQAVESIGRQRELLDFLCCTDQFG